MQNSTVIAMSACSLRFKKTAIYGSNRTNVPKVAWE